MRSRITVRASLNRDSLTIIWRFALPLHRCANGSTDRYTDANTDGDIVDCYADGRTNSRSQRDADTDLAA